MQLFNFLFKETTITLCALCAIHFNYENLKQAVDNDTAIYNKMYCDLCGADAEY